MSPLGLGTSIVPTYCGSGRHQKRTHAIRCQIGEEGGGGLGGGALNVKRTLHAAQHLCMCCDAVDVGLPLTGGDREVSTAEERAADHRKVRDRILLLAAGIAAGGGALGHLLRLPLVVVLQPPHVAAAARATEAR